MTIAMLALAGFPATAGFFGKIYLIEAAVDNGYAWLGVVIVLGSAISLAYYLRVVAAVWMRVAGRGARAAGRGPRAPGDRRRLAGGRRGGPRRRPRARRDVGASSSPTSTPPTPVRRGSRQPEVVFVAVVCALATIASGSTPSRCSTSPRDARRALITSRCVVNSRSRRGRTFARAAL